MPWLTHVAARESGSTLSDFHDLQEWEKREWFRFALQGPSRFRDTMILDDIRTIIVAYFSGKTDILKQDRDWMDGMMMDPQELKEQRESDKREREWDAHLAMVAEARRKETK